MVETWKERYGRSCAMLQQWGLLATPTLPPILLDSLPPVSFPDSPLTDTTSSSTNTEVVTIKPQKKKVRRKKWPHYVEKDDFFNVVVQDRVYAPQQGPMCAAASIASVVRSFLVQEGELEEDLEHISQETVAAVYKRMGVKIEGSTKHVGNMRLKRCIHLYGGVIGRRLTPRELEVTLVEDKVEAREALWERMLHELQSGKRILGHISNHYCRIFGLRQGKPHCPSGKPLFSGKKTGGDSDDENDAPEEDKATKLLGVCGVDYEEPQEGILRKEVLLAIRGQSPKHWVNFYDMCKLFETVKMYKLFTVDMK